jgi:hypothetical protein
VRRQGGKSSIEGTYGRARGADDNDVVFHLILLLSGRARQKQCPFEVLYLNRLIPPYRDKTVARYGGKRLSCLP